MVDTQPPRPVVLCVLDGWGEAVPSAHNAIRLARTPVLDRLYASVPHALVDASEHEVGLPAGQMGNSEVGHMNLGAGRVVLQDLPRIDRAVDEGRLAELPALQDLIRKLKASGGTAHLLGLLSPGGVHSHQRHLAALANALAAARIPVAIHAFLDGRDTPPRSAIGYLERFAREAPKARIATVSGRYYAMDRDKRWERTALAYGALVSAEGERAPDAPAAVEQSYHEETHDEFVRPTVIDGYSGMTDGDAIVMGNFRADRARQILAALLDPAFESFPRSKQVAFVGALGLADYGAELAPFLSALFPPQDLSHTLGEVVAERGLKQLRIAETEKYAHVTFFFNGGREEVFPGEERILVPSPKVATYDLKPEMSAPELTDRLVEAILSDRFDFIVVNYANGDMVGHTGKLEAAIAAVETVDRCLGRIAEAIERTGGALLITSDHGNAEQMTDEASNQPHTAHTMNKVPLILVGAPDRTAKLSDGRLADLAPTLLALMKLPQPSEMTGRSLLRDAAGEAAAE